MDSFNSWLANPSCFLISDFISSLVCSSNPTHHLRSYLHPPLSPSHPPVYMTPMCSDHMSEATWMWVREVSSNGANSCNGPGVASSGRRHVTFETCQSECIQCTTCEGVHYKGVDDITSNEYTCWLRTDVVYSEILASKPVFASNRWDMYAIGTRAQQVHCRLSISVYR